MNPDPRYPIGIFQKQDSYSSEQRAANIEVLKNAAANLRTALQGLSEAKLDTPYRDRGWTIRQVAHHLPDSHANAYIRIKLALTEIEPIIKPYDEEAWALLSDTKIVALEVSVTLLEAIHTRLVALLESLTEADWTRVYKHPVNGVTTVEQALADYAWHSTHHIAHIQQLRTLKGW